MVCWSETQCDTISADRNTEKCVSVLDKSERQIHLNDAFGCALALEIHLRYLANCR